MMRRAVLLVILMAGCLPEAIVDPATCKVDPVLEGTWLAKGQLLEQCMHGEVEYGPGEQHSLYLVKAFDERCYLITALDYYLPKDGRLGIFGPGGGGPLSQWRAWLAPIGERQYLICHQIDPDVPHDPDVVTSPGDFFPTFEIERAGADDVTLTPVFLPDILQRLGGAMSKEEYARRLAAFPPVASSQVVCAWATDATRASIPAASKRRRRMVRGRSISGNERPYGPTPEM
jgi:hypothetical protein